MTKMNAAVETSLEAIRGINDNIVRLRDEAKAARAAAIEPFLAALAASGEVSLIIIYGWTPGFNDGEPCEHSADYFVNVESALGEDMFDHGLELDDLADELSGDDGEITAESTEAAGHVWGKPNETIMSAINDVIFDTVEEEEGTNYFVTYVLRNGKFERNTGEYECGY